MIVNRTPSLFKCDGLPEIKKTPIMTETMANKPIVHWWAPCHSPKTAAPTNAFTAIWPAVFKPDACETPIFLKAANWKLVPAAQAIPDKTYVKPAILKTTGQVGPSNKAYTPTTIEKTSEPSAPPKIWFATRPPAHPFTIPIAPHNTAGIKAYIIDMYHFSLSTLFYQR